MSLTEKSIKDPIKNLINQVIKSIKPNYFNNESLLLPKIYELTNTPIDFKYSSAIIIGRPYFDFNEICIIDPPTFQLQFIYTLDNYSEVKLYMRNDGLVLINGQNQSKIKFNDPKYKPAWLVYNHLLNRDCNNYVGLDKDYFLGQRY